VPVVFTPYLRKVLGAETDETDSSGDRPPEATASTDGSGGRVVLGAAAAAVAAVAAWRLRRRLADPAPDGDAATTAADEQDGQDDGDGTRLRRVGRGWLRR